MVYFGPTRAGFQRLFQRDVQRRQHEHDFPMPQLKIRLEGRDNIFLFGRMVARCIRVSTQKTSFQRAMCNFGLNLEVWFQIIKKEKAKDTWIRYMTFVHKVMKSDC